MISTDICSGRLTEEQLAANFTDVHPPLDHRGALVEAHRCYFCFDAPCIDACPTRIDIPNFIRKISTGNLKGAATNILSQNIMGGMCARVCPTEILCEGSCVREAQEHQPVRIGDLQRYVTDSFMQTEVSLFERTEATGKRIAVVGGGPAGLSCAHRLAMLGHNVVIFEAQEKLSGLNEYGIAPYKTTDNFAQHEVNFIMQMEGIETRTNQKLGQEIKLNDLTDEFDAVFLGIGLGDVNQLGVENEETDGVFNAVETIADLRQANNLSEIAIGRRVVVIGGGNTAIDMAVQSKKLGAEDVTLAYRRGPEQMSATWKEQEFALTNGVRIKHWISPMKIITKDGFVSGVEFECMCLTPENKLEATGETRFIEADMVFKSIGQALADTVFNGFEMPEIQAGKIVVNNEYETSISGIWAGGDCVRTGEDLTVQSVEDGKQAALAIDRKLAAG